MGCYLKWNVEPQSAWSPDPNVISDWSMHALQGQLDDCDVCEQGGYTGYNHLNSGGKPSDQLAFTVDGGAGEDPWWKCAEMCSMRQDDKACEGWTFAYDGDGHATSYKCYLKWNVEPQSAWSPDPNVISGWSMHALQGQLDDCDVCEQGGYTG